jgi:DNA-directed RNA polymerase subunit omega
MMRRISTGDLVGKEGSYYSLVIGVAKRAREIAETAEEEGVVLVEKPVQLAVEELAKGDYSIHVKEDLGKEIE